MDFEFVRGYKLSSYAIVVLTGLLVRAQSTTIDAISISRPTDAPVLVFPTPDYNPNTPSTIPGSCYNGDLCISSAENIEYADIATQNTTAWYCVTFSRNCVGDSSCPDMGNGACSGMWYSFSSESIMNYMLAYGITRNTCNTKNCNVPSSGTLRMNELHVYATILSIATMSPSPSPSPFEGAATRRFSFQGSGWIPFSFQFLGLSLFLIFFFDGLI